MISGQLSERSLPSLLFQLLRERFTGEVAIDAPTGAAHLYLREGCPVYVTLSETAELLGRVLLDLRLLDEAGYRRSLATPPGPGQRYGDVLLTLGLCDEAKLLQGLRVQVGRKLQRLFPLSRGGYVQLPGEHRYGMQGSTSVAVNPLWVILFGLRAVPRPRLLTWLEPVARRVLKVRAADNRLQHYGLSADERAHIEALRREERTAAEVLGGPLEKAQVALPLLYALLCTDALDLGAERAGAPWPPPALTQPEAEPPRSNNRPSSGIMAAVRPTPTGQAAMPARSPTGAQPVVAAPRPPTGAHATVPASRPGSGSQPVAADPRIATGQHPARRDTDPTPTGRPISGGQPARRDTDPAGRAVASSQPRLSTPLAGLPRPATPGGGLPRPGEGSAPGTQELPSGVRLPPARSPGERLMAKALSQRAGLHVGAKGNVRASGGALKTLSPRDRSLLAAELEHRSKLAPLEDFFALLGVAEDADFPVVEKAYLQLMTRYDAERLNELGLKAYQTHAGRITSRAIEARAILGDPERRRRYVEQMGAEREAGKGEKSPEVRKLRGELALARALVFLRGRELEEALPELELCCRMNPEHGEAMGHLAWVRFSLLQIKLDEATRQLLAAARIAPNSAMLLYYLGVVYKQQDNEERAIKCFTRVTQLDPSLTEAASELRLIQARAGRKDKGGRLKPRELEARPAGKEGEGKEEEKKEEKKGGGFREFFSQPLGDILRRPLGGGGGGGAGGPGPRKTS